MDLQNAYYLAALIFLTLGSAFFIGCIAFLAFLFFAFKNAKHQLGGHIDDAIDYSKKKSAAAGFVLVAVGKLLSKMKEKKNNA